VVKITPFKALDIFNMRINYILFFAILVSSVVFGQDYKIKYATELSAEYKFAEALPVWEELSNVALKKKTNQVFVLSKTVEAAFLSEHFKKSVYWFNKLAPSLTKEKLNTTEKQWGYYIQALKLTGLGARINNALDSALNANPESIQIQSLNQQQDSYQTNVNNTSEYVVRSYKKGSKGEEYGAFPYKTGVLFVSNEFNHNAINRNYPRTGQYYSDIAFYDSVKALEKYTFFQKPFWTNIFYKNLWRDMDRTRAHDGPISFSQDKSLAFVTSNFNEKDKTDTVKYRRLQLRVYSVKGDEFTEINFPFNSPQFNTGHATMDNEGNVYFASDRPGSMIAGYEFNAKTKKLDTIYSSDIWKTTYKEGTWSTPEPLGTDINTVGDELFPFISSWGVLYFSSNAWGSLGGLDIFSSELTGKNPVHIGAPLNSTSDDFSYFVDEETGKGFFSTNREQFVDRIYAFSKPVFKSDILVNLQNCKGKPLADAMVYITDLNNGEISEFTTDVDGKTTPLSLKRNHEYKVVYTASEWMTTDSLVYKAIDPISKSVDFTSYFKRFTTKITILDSIAKPMANAIIKMFNTNGTTISMTTDNSGSYVWRNEEDMKIDSILVNAINYEDGHLVIPSEVNGNCIDTVVYTLQMKKLSDEQFIRLDMVLYNFDKYFLRPEGKAELDKLVAYMNAHPMYRVELSSHTDSRGSDKYNMRLSKNRAKSCVDYIISKGISKKLITAQGYGETRHVNKCSNGVACSKEEHQANRRTELKLFTPEEEALDNNKLKE
jgi:outer membrane protein OmpA-like peptidoglycan-associated protein